VLGGNSVDSGGLSDAMLECKREGKPILVTTFLHKIHGNGVICYIKMVGTMGHLTLHRKSMVILFWELPWISGDFPGIPN